MDSGTEQTMSMPNGDAYTVPFFIDGNEVQAKKSFDVISPATHKVVHRCGAASNVEAAAAVDAAAKAFGTWKSSTPKSRRDILIKAAQITEKRRDELAGYMIDETGCTRGWADFNLNLAGDHILDIAGRVSTLEGSIPATQDAAVGAFVLREPFGVVLAIAPWNAPYILGIRSVLLPIAAGNTVIFKGSELSPRVGWAISSVFHEAGLPAGVLNFLIVERIDAPDITASLIGQPEVKKVNFTGSTHVGRIIGKLCGEHLKPVLLELGGKAPAIVWEDAELEKAATQCALGAFLHGGQICMSTERILVHKAVRAEFEQLLVQAIDSIFGSGGDAPVLISSLGAEKARNLVRDAVEKGAKIVYGDHLAEESSKTRMRPLVISGVSTEMDIYRTESFGPSVSLFEIETEEEALRMANDTEYGLSSAVFTRDLRRGLRLAKGIETGAVHINSMTVHDEAALPHGGVKASGFGRFNGSNLAEWTRTKSVTFQY